MPSRTMKIVLLGSEPRRALLSARSMPRGGTIDGATGVAACAGAGENRGSDIARLFIHGQRLRAGRAGKELVGAPTPLGRHRALQRGDIGRNSLHILLLRSQQIIGHRLHPTGRRAVLDVPALMQVCEQMLRVPRHRHRDAAFKAGAYQSSASPPASALSLASAPRKLRVL